MSMIVIIDVVFSYTIIFTYPHYRYFNILITVFLNFGLTIVIRFYIYYFILN